MDKNVLSDLKKRAIVENYFDILLLVNILYKLHISHHRRHIVIVAYRPMWVRD